VREREREREIINFKLWNIWKIEYKKQEIKAPKDFIKMEEIIGKMYNIWGEKLDIESEDLEYLDY